MSRFADLSGPKQEPEPHFQEIPGAFGCQSCYEHVDTARYYPVQKILRWTCPQNHVSFIEDFKI